MRIFGKRRKRTSTDSASPHKENNDAKANTEGGNEVQNKDEKDPTSIASQGARQADEEREEVRSYFSPDFFSSATPTGTSKKKTQDIQELLAMDPKCLTSKQRRLIRRHQERTGSSSIKKEEFDKNEKVVADKKSSRAEVSKQYSKDGTLEGLDEQISPNSGNVRKGQDTINDNFGLNSNDKMEGKEQKLQTMPCATTTDEESANGTGKNGDNLQEIHAVVKNTTHVTTNIGDNISSSDKEKTVPFEEKEPQATSENTAASSSCVLDQLKNLNSKERRKLLRKLAQESKVMTTDAICSVEAGNNRNSGGCDNDPAVMTSLNDAPKTASELIVQAAEESRRVAAQNVAMMKEKVELQKQMKKNKRKPEELDKPTKDTNDDAVQSNPSTSKKRKIKDWSNLPPDERKRRENQRQMQKEAAERRKAGEVLTRHPLNSERRRANRRKPGRAGKIALLKKETKEKLADMRSYNAGGYQMRHHSKNNHK